VEAIDSHLEPEIANFVFHKHDSNDIANLAIPLEWLPAGGNDTWDEYSVKLDFPNEIHTENNQTIDNSVQFEYRATVDFWSVERCDILFGEEVSGHPVGRLGIRTQYLPEGVASEGDVCGIKATLVYTGTS